MLEWYKDLSYIFQALLATLFTWSITALGASLVFIFKKIRRKLFIGMLGFASGVMISASFWSLLSPAVEYAKEMKTYPWIPVTTGFLAGGFFIYFIDKILPHQHPAVQKTEGIKTNWNRAVLLVLAITLHNIPEGLAIGVSFGSLESHYSDTNFYNSIALAIGIGIQNFPEGLAIAAPLRSEGRSKLTAFYYGQLSAIVEPIASVIGAIMITIVKPLLPYALSFAAGAMIYVVIEELIPEAHEETDSDLATIWAMIGFAIMTFLDVALSKGSQLL